MDDLRHACAAVAARAESVGIETGAIAAYAASLPLPSLTAPPSTPPESGADPDRVALDDREQLAAYWLGLDAINFGSGWFPTLRKAPGVSGYRTIAAGWRAQAEAHGPWTASELERLDARTLAPVLGGQDPAHPLMERYAASLRDLAGHVAGEHGGSFAAVVDAADGSAVRLARALGHWSCFADCSRYDELRLAFLKRAQIAAADLARAGVAEFGDLAQLTMFADNLVPHVLRLDGVLRLHPALVARIDRGELIAHDSPEEVEIRACALHAVELIVAARPGTRAADVDQLLWQRGQEPRYKAAPRHRSRCSAY